MKWLSMTRPVAISRIRYLWQRYISTITYVYTSVVENESIYSAVGDYDITRPTRFRLSSLKAPQLFFINLASTPGERSAERPWLRAGDAPVRVVTRPIGLNLINQTTTSSSADRWDIVYRSNACVPVWFSLTKTKTKMAKNEKMTNSLTKTKTKTKNDEN